VRGVGRPGRPVRWERAVMCWLGPGSARNHAGAEDRRCGGCRPGGGRTEPIWLGATWHRGRARTAQLRWGGEGLDARFVSRLRQAGGRTRGDASAHPGRVRGIPRDGMFGFGVKANRGVCCASAEHTCQRAAGLKGCVFGYGTEGGLTRRRDATSGGRGRKSSHPAVDWLHAEPFGAPSGAPAGRPGHPHGEAK